MPDKPTESQIKESSRIVCWADVSLGVFLCARYGPGTSLAENSCAKLHQKHLPKSISKGRLCLRLNLTPSPIVLCLEWDCHYWNFEDLLKCAEWGNYSAQKFPPCFTSANHQILGIYILWQLCQ